MKRKKWAKRILFIAEVLLLAIILAASCMMLFWYGKYGQEIKVKIKSTSKLYQEEAPQVERLGEEASREGGTEEASREEVSNEKISPENPEQESEISTNERVEWIRVRIMSQDYEESVHQKVVVSGDSSLEITELSMEQFLLRNPTGGTMGKENNTRNAMEKNSIMEENITEEIKKNMEDAQRAIEISKEEMNVGEVMMVRDKEDGLLTLESLQRACGCPSYSGILYFIREDKGIAVINEVLLETYLYSVVSSEMPSDYPMEAQKAQAVCARTYAVNCISKNDGTLFEDLDDSVMSQVYNNQKWSKQSKEAVDDTYGEILGIQEIQYYSTSCQSEHYTNLSDEAAFQKFLSETPDEDAEYNSPWLRWTTTVPACTLLEHLEIKENRDINGEISVTIIKREGNGRLSQIEVNYHGETYQIEGEFEIRKVFGDALSEIGLMDGSSVSGMELLPSAFFYFCSSEGEPLQEGSYGMKDKMELVGGGYGHGNGMSQCGAAQLALKGLDYEEILEYYYNTRIEK